MNTDNKEILKRANEAVSTGDYEKFLSFCADDSIWTFVGDQILKGKDAIRKYLIGAYLEPPRFEVEDMVSERDLLTVIGKISLKQEDSSWSDFQYCDVWRFKNGKMIELKAFVI